MTDLETARVVVVGFVLLLFIFFTVLIHLIYKFTKMIRLYQSYVDHEKGKPRECLLYVSKST